jgi:tetratricopeptide (TPR) repeat protein
MACRRSAFFGLLALLSPIAALADTTGPNGREPALTDADLKSLIVQMRKASPALDPTEADRVTNLVRTRPREQDTVVACARLALDAGRNEDAIRISSHGLRLFPESVPLLSYRGVGYAQSDQPDKAKADLSAALEKEPGHERGYNWYRRAVVNSTLQDQKAAMADIREAIRRHRDGERVAFYAHLLAEDGQLTEGLTQAKAAVELEPGLAYGHLMLGFIHNCRGDTARAEAAFAEANRVSPTATTRAAIEVVRRNSEGYRRLTGQLNTGPKN